MPKISFFCRSDQCTKCSGKKLKDGIGPVQIENCKCKCHKFEKPF